MFIWMGQESSGNDISTDLQKENGSITGQKLKLADKPGPWLLW